LVAPTTNTDPAMLDFNIPGFDRDEEILISTPDILENEKTHVIHK
jgi:hypothetical protein